MIKRILFLVFFMYFNLCKAQLQPLPQATSTGLLSKTETATKTASTGNTVTFTGLSNATALTNVKLMLQAKYNNKIYEVVMGDGATISAQTTTTVTINFDTFVSLVPIGSTFDFILRVW